MLEQLTWMQIAAILFAVSVPLSVAFIALIGRLNGKDEHVVDIRAVNQRYAEDEE